MGGKEDAAQYKCRQTGFRPCGGADMLRRSARHNFVVSPPQRPETYCGGKKLHCSYAAVAVPAATIVPAHL